MKLKYILGAFAAAALFAGCQSEPMVGTFQDLELDKAFVSIDMAGGSAVVTVKSDDAWTFTKHIDTGKKDEDGKKIYVENPSWITLSTLTGPAGQTQVTITATSTEAGREAELQIKSGDHLQHLIVRQGTLEAVAATCAEVMEGPDGKTFKVTGKVVSIANTTYGNWYLDDGSYPSFSGGNKDGVYVYGTLDKDGKEKNFTSLGIEVGDVVTVSGPKTTYNGTVELVNVTVHKIEKALLTVLTEPVNLPVAGGEFQVKVAFKGKGVLFNIDEETASWVSFKESSFKAGVATLFEKNPADTAFFTFNVAPNEGEKRVGHVVFESSSGKSKTEAAFEVTQSPYTIATTSVAEALAIIDGLSDGATTDEEYYVKGYITGNAGIDTGYGNATFKLTDDGSADSPAITVFRAKWLENVPFTADDQLKEGDMVIIVGKLQRYVKNDVMTPEVSSCHVFSVPVAGTLDNPYLVGAALSIIDTMEDGKTADEEVFVTGIVTGGAGIDTGYGNATFKLTADGKADSPALTVFRAKDFQNKGFTDAAKFKEGDRLVVIGKLQRYVKNDVMTPELSYGYLVSINGETE